jgi:hypothetical protein
MDDRSFLEAEQAARNDVAKGAIVFQKWTCGGCGERITGNNKNFFAVEGHCEKCDYVTNLAKAGCGYMAIWGGS